VNATRVEGQAPIGAGDLLWLGPPQDPESVCIECRFEPWVEVLPASLVDAAAEAPAAETRQRQPACRGIRSTRRDARRAARRSQNSPNARRRSGAPLRSPRPGRPRRSRPSSGVRAPGSLPRRPQGSKTPSS
jgi:hypothetical protein